MLLAFLLVGVVIAYLCALAFVPKDRIRGIALTAVLLLTTLCWNPVAPAAVREAALWSSVTLLCLTLFTQRDWKNGSRFIPAVTLILFATSMVVTLEVYPDGFSALLRVSLLAALTAMVVHQFSPQDRGALLTGIVLVGVFQSAIGLWEFFTGEAPFLWGYGIRDDGTEAIYLNALLPGEPRIQGTLGHPIPYSLIIAIALISLISKWRSIPRFWALLIFALLSSTLFLAGTRITILAVIVALTYLLLLTGPSARRIRNLLAAAVIVVLAVSANLQLDSRVDELLESGSFTNRASAIASVPKLLQQDFFTVLTGHGWGSEPTLFAQGYLQQNGFNVVDNQLVSTLATQGVLALILLSIAFFAAFAKSDPVKRALVLVMTVMLFSFDYMRWPSMVVVLFLILALPSERKMGHEREEGEADAAQSISAQQTKVGL